MNRASDLCINLQAKIEAIQAENGKLYSENTELKAEAIHIQTQNQAIGQSSVVELKQLKVDTSVRIYFECKSIINRI